MKTKRYLVLPVEGVRLSDALSVSDVARDVLELLQPKHNAELGRLGHRLFASAAGAVAGPARARARAGAAAASPRARTTRGASALTVVKSLSEDGVKLVEATEEMATRLRRENSGIRVIEEKFCHRAVAPRVAVPTSARRSGARRAAAGPTLVVRVVRADTGAPVAGADVLAFRTAADALERRTNAAGKATFRFGRRVTRLSRLYVYHERPGLWGYFKPRVSVAQGEVEVRLTVLDVAAADALRHFHGAGALGDGVGVRVGVIDSGADVSHPDAIGRH